MFLDWNFLVSVITSSAAILALFQAMHQTKLSNRQHLFDRRLKLYMLANGLIDLCKDNYTQLSSKRDCEPLFANDFNFIWLTNNTYMEKHADAIKHPLQQPFHNDFLRKREELRNAATEFQLIFKKKEATAYSEFINAYEAALFSMYQYQIVIDNMKSANTENPMTIEQAQKLCNEPDQHKQLDETIDRLKEAYNIVSQEKVKKKIKQQLILK